MDLLKRGAYKSKENREFTVIQYLRIASSFDTLRHMEMNCTASPLRAFS